MKVVHAVLAGVGAVVVGLLILSGLGSERAVSETLGELLTGWWTYPRDVLPRVRYDWGRIGSAAAWIALFAVGFHLFARWLYRETGLRTADAARRWRARWTLLVVLLVMILFSAGTATVGIAHQVGFMMSPTEKVYDYPRRLRRADIEGAAYVAQELLEAAIKEKLPASRILVADVSYSTIYGYLHDEYHLAGVDGPDGVIRALIMYPRDPDDLRAHGVSVATAERAWTEREKAPREVFAELAGARGATSRAAATTRGAALDR